MTVPSPDSPNDRFDPENYQYADPGAPSWNNPYQPTSDRTPVPYAAPSGVPAPASSSSSAELERQAAERRAITVRIVIALVLAVPLTAIAGGIMGGGISSLLGMALAWAGIALVVYLSHGKGFPFRAPEPAAATRSHRCDPRARPQPPPGRWRWESAQQFAHPAVGEQLAAGLTARAVL